MRDCVFQDRVRSTLSQGPGIPMSSVHHPASALLPDSAAPARPATVMGTVVSPRDSRSPRSTSTRSSNSTTRTSKKRREEHKKPLPGTYIYFCYYNIKNVAYISAELVIRCVQKMICRVVLRLLHDWFFSRPYCNYKCYNGCH